MRNLLIIFAIIIIFTGCAGLGFSNLFDDAFGADADTKIDKSKPMTMFVLDVSGSMNAYDNQSKLTMIESAKKNIKDIALTLDSDKTNFMLLEFGGWCSVSTRINPTNDTREFVKNISSISAAGDTPLASAIRKAGYMAKNSNTAVHIIILSDGMETCGGDPQYEMRNLIAQNPNVKISAFVLGYNVDSTTRSVLQGLIYGDGRYFDVKDSAQMLVALNSITTNLNISQSGWDNGVYDFQINFDHDSDKIKPEFQDNVKRLAEYLKQSGNTTQIQERTNNVGEEI
ncbi:MAG: vWA domain-containing protein [Campylobacter sp.]